MTVMRELRNNGFRMYMARLPPDIRKNAADIRSLIIPAPLGSDDEKPTK